MFAEKTVMGLIAVPTALRVPVISLLAGLTAAMSSARVALEVRLRGNQLSCPDSMWSLPNRDGFKELV